MRNLKKVERRQRWWNKLCGASRKEKDDMKEELFNFGRFSIHRWGRINMVSFVGCSELLSPDFPKGVSLGVSGSFEPEPVVAINLNHTTFLV